MLRKIFHLNAVIKNFSVSLIRLTLWGKKIKEMRHFLAFIYKPKAKLIVFYFIFLFKADGSISNQETIRTWLSGYSEELRTVMHQVALAGWNYFASASLTTKQFLDEAEEVCSSLKNIIKREFYQKFQNNS